MFEFEREVDADDESEVKCGCGRLCKIVVEDDVNVFKFVL